MTEKSEVKITYKPIKEIVILEYSQYSLDTLVGLHGLPTLGGGLVPPLNWAEGIIFAHSAMPPDRLVLQEMREAGRIYWNHVAFALMPQYQPTVTITTKGGTITVNVLNVTTSPALRAAAKWLKERTSK